MRCQVLAAVMAILIVYLLIGGLVFWRLESQHDARNEIRQRQQQQLQQQQASSFIDVDAELVEYINWEIDRRWHQLRVKEAVSAETDDALDNETSVCLSKMDLLNAITNWTDARLMRAEKQRQHKWDFPGSIFFALTVVTTIGYGNLVPRAAGSRAFCCAYAVVGIPLCLMAIVNIGAQLDSATRWVERYLQRGCCTSASRMTSRPRYWRAVVFALVGAVFFLLVPAIVFSRLQDWDYGTAVYFAMVSLSTIGFGDYVAGINYVGPGTSVYRLMVCAWIFLGLAWLAGVFSSLQDCFQSIAAKIDKCFASCGAIQKDVRTEAAGECIVTIATINENIGASFEATTTRMNSS